ncbi:hypothetical protein ACIOHS_01985 [Streptomyces sp. NPDC088253]
MHARSALSILSATSSAISARDQLIRADNPAPGRYTTEESA